MVRVGHAVKHIPRLKGTSPQVIPALNMPTLNGLPVRSEHVVSGNLGHECCLQAGESDESDQIVTLVIEVEDTLFVGYIAGSVTAGDAGFESALNHVASQVISPVVASCS